MTNSSTRNNEKNFDTERMKIFSTQRCENNADKKAHATH